MLRLLCRLPQAVKPRISAADADGSGKFRLLHDRAQMACAGGGARHKFRRFIAADDEHDMLVAEQTQLCGRAALCDPLPLRLEAIGALHQRRQRNRMEPSAKFNTCGERRLRQFLRCIGLQKTLEEMILQYLIRQHGPAVEALPVVAAREFRGQVLQQLVKFLWTDRLEQIIVYMIPDGLLRIGEFAEAGQHNDNRIREFFVDIPCQFQSIDEGHADICDDHIRQYGFQLIKRLPAVFKYMGRRKAELFPICVLRHGLPDKHFIFHKHDLVHTARPPLHL